MDSLAFGKQTLIYGSYQRSIDAVTQVTPTLKLFMGYDAQSVRNRELYGSVLLLR